MPGGGIQLARKKQLLILLKPEHARIAGYFNFDNGRGRIRGIYAQNNVAVKPVFEEWLKPFHDLGATHVVVRETGGSDHGALDYSGLPAFQFIQGPLDYGTCIHNMNMDVFDHLIIEDLMQASVVMAAFVYNAATREEMLPSNPSRTRCITRSAVSGGGQ